MRFPGPARNRPPAEVLARVGAVRADRVLAFARAEDSWVLGTPLALLVVGTGDEPVLRIPWESIENAGWDQEKSVLEVSEVGEWGVERPTHHFAMPDPGGPVRLLQLVRERVTASIVLQRRVPVFGERGFTINARRSPAGGEVTWFVEYDVGVRPDDPDVAARAAAGLAHAQAELI